MTVEAKEKDPGRHLNTRNEKLKRRAGTAKVESAIQMSLLKPHGTLVANVNGNFINHRGLYRKT